MNGVIRNEVWTVERVDQLKSLWAAGHSCAQIASDLGCFAHCFDRGRSAVIGKVHRLKLPVPASKTYKRGNQRVAARALAAGPFLTSPAPRLRNGHAPALRRNPSHNVEASIESAQRAPGLPAKFNEPGPGEGVQLIDLTDSTCRWPFGRPGTEEFYFCGDASASLKDGRPYCAFHQRKSQNHTAIRSPKAFEKSALIASY